MYTLQGKTRPTWHICFPRQSTYAQRTLLAGGPRMCQPFTSHQLGWTDALHLRKSAPDSTSQPDWVVRRTHLDFSPNTAIEAVRLSQAHVDGRILGLPGPYHRHAIGTFNTCSWVPTPRSLTDTGRGYHKENLGIATTLSLPFPSEGSTNPPNGPARSQIIRTTFTNWTGEGTRPKSREWEPPFDFYCNLPSKHCITNSKPPQDGGNKDKRKEDLNVSTVSFNSYKLNAQAYGIINKAQI
jgi:hypothetical protein